MPPTKAATDVPLLLAKNASTRDRLIEAGLHLMRKHGYGATGLQEILDLASVPKGSFYHHFGSKETFAAAVIERYNSLSDERSQRILGSARQAPLKRLRRYFEDLIQIAGQAAPISGCLIGGLSLEVASSSSLLQSHLSLSFGKWQAAIADVLLEAKQIGELPMSIQHEALAGFVLNSWEGALLRSQADRNNAPLNAFVHYVFEQLLAK